VREAPGKGRGTAQESVVFWAIIMNSGSWVVALRATPLVKDDSPHSFDGQQSAIAHI